MIIVQNAVRSTFRNADVACPIGNARTGMNGITALFAGMLFLVRRLMAKAMTDAFGARS